MKNNIIFLSLFTLLSLGFSACKKYSSGTESLPFYHSKGVITGIDNSKCACCGGIEININGKQYLFDKIPENSSLYNTTLKFPLSVELDWTSDAEKKCDDRISVLTISPMAVRHSVGYITGFDYTMCACCGGTYITINSQKYRFYTSPLDGSLGHVKLPYKVSVDWIPLLPSCKKDSIISINSMTGIN